jgi:N utilization substance protein A
MIPNALQPAEVEDVMLFPMLGRAIVLVKEDQLSLAIGRRGQNVRLASKLAGWDIEIMTSEELDEQIERAVTLFGTIPNLDSALIDRFVEQGFLSFDDLSIMDPEELAQLEGLDVAKAMDIVEFAEREAERLAKEAPPPKSRTAAAATAVGEESAETPADTVGEAQGNVAQELPSAEPSEAGESTDHEGAEAVETTEVQQPPGGGGNGESGAAGHSEAQAVDPAASPGEAQKPTGE